MELLDKLSVLADAAKYDAACTSSGAKRGFEHGKIGCTSSGVMGCCHSFSADGRCITLLKVLLSNDCMYDCKYCVNRRTNETRRATFTPEELADLTIQFYRRNYIEGLFLSSGVLRSPDYTTELMIRALSILRREYRFNGYIHAKAIPGASPELVEQLGMLADRLSVNIELPSEASLRALAPNKTKAAVLRPMRFIADRGQENRRELVKYRHAPRFAPAGQATQMIVGATGESDRHILTLTQSLYDTYHLKRVFYSAYVPVVENTLLPSLDTKPPLLREHRLYQAEWMELAKDNYAHVALKPHVREYLEKLRAQGERMAVFTSCVPAHCKTALAVHDLNRCFERVIFAQELGMDKSDPAIFAKATELLGVTPQECIFFDDSVKSCRSAKASGMTVIGVYDPFFEGTKDEMPLVCDRFIRDFGEML